MDTQLKERSSRQKLLKSPHMIRDIEDDITNLIKKNVLKPGDRLSSEKRLSEIYNASLYQVRKGIRNLIAKGILYSVPKSGVFIKGNKSDEISPKKMFHGVNLFEISSKTKCKVKFLVGHWHITDVEFWEKTTSEYSKNHSSIEIVPVFPRSHDEFLKLADTCDLVLTFPWELFRNYQNYSKIEPFHPNEAAAWPIAPKYLTGLRYKNGIAGIPIASALLIGSIINQEISESFANKLLTSKSWEEIFSLLEIYQKKHPHLKAFNLHHTFTLNAYHFVRLAGGEILNRDHTEIDMKSQHIIRVLELIDKFRNSVIVSEEDRDTFLSQEYIADICYDNANAVTPEHLQRIPWLYPVEKSYPEAVAIGCIFKHSYYIEEAKKFLTFLLTGHVQEELNKCPTLNGISESLKDKYFNKYPPEWKNIFEKIKSESFIFGEYVPGYCEFLHDVFCPEMKRFFHGGITVKEVANIIQERGNKILNKYN